VTALARLALVASLTLSAACAAPARRAPSLEGRPQARSLSCESRSACDLLAFHGIHVSEDDFLAGLPRSDNPDLGFVGDPDGPTGGLPPDPYGVHAGPVAQVLRRFGLDAREERGRDLAWLRGELDAGRPVLVWVVAGLRASPRQAFVDSAGRPFHAVRGEHAVLALRSLPGRLVVLDPAHGEERTWDEAPFLASWNLFDRAAVCAVGTSGKTGRER
jgi:uncharacterized protein YvpB